MTSFGRSTSHLRKHSQWLACEACDVDYNSCVGKAPLVIHKIYDVPFMFCSKCYRHLRNKGWVKFQDRTIYQLTWVDQRLKKLRASCDARNLRLFNERFGNQPIAAELESEITDVSDPTGSMYQRGLCESCHVKSDTLYTTPFAGQRWQLCPSCKSRRYRKKVIQFGDLMLTNDLVTEANQIRAQIDKAYATRVVQRTQSLNASKVLTMLAATKLEKPVFTALCDAYLSMDDVVRFIQKGNSAIDVLEACDVTINDLAIIIHRLGLANRMTHLKTLVKKQAAKPVNDARRTTHVPACVYDNTDLKEGSEGHDPMLDAWLSNF